MPGNWRERREVARSTIVSDRPRTRAFHVPHRWPWPTVVPWTRRRRTSVARSARFGFASRRVAAAQQPRRDCRSAQAQRLVARHERRPGVMPRRRHRSSRAGRLPSDMSRGAAMRGASWPHPSTDLVDELTTLTASSREHRIPRRHTDTRRRPTQGAPRGSTPPVAQTSPTRCPHRSECSSRPAHRRRRFADLGADWKSRLVSRISPARPVPVPTASTWRLTFGGPRPRSRRGRGFSEMTHDRRTLEAGRGDPRSSTPATSRRTRQVRPRRHRAPSALVPGGSTNPGSVATRPAANGEPCRLGPVQEWTKYLIIANF